MEQKITFDDNITFDDKFCDLLRLYLFETPVENTSRRGRTFKDIGWVGSSRFQMLERLLKAASEIQEQNWIFREISEIAKLDIINRTDIQYVVSSMDKGKVGSMIYAIRNAFAHGSFKKLDNGWYLLENNYHGKLKARIVVDEDTLFKWMRIIKTDPSYFTKKKSRAKGAKNKRGVAA